MAEIIWLQSALSDLRLIHAYIARDSPDHAAAFIVRILQSAENLDPFVRLGRVVPERGSDTLRELLIDDYRLMYRLRGGKVEILSVVHGSVDLYGWARRVGWPNDEGREE